MGSLWLLEESRLSFDARAPVIRHCYLRSSIVEFVDGIDDGYLHNNDNISHMVSEPVITRVGYVVSSVHYLTGIQNKQKKLLTLSDYGSTFN